VGSYDKVEDCFEEIDGEILRETEIDGVCPRRNEIGVGKVRRRN
jgi:hypothetical protein